ncbi:MAG: hypothetical protein K6G26_01465 [Lachnospiraceae bacterium]|nr:hypothetical protein [Lachnospiraceae bacterium]
MIGEKQKTTVSLAQYIITTTIICAISFVLLYKQRSAINRQVNDLKVQVTSIKGNENDMSKAIDEIQDNNSESKYFNENAKKAYNVSNIKGLYTFDKKLDNVNEVHYKLCLYENGTFHYSFGNNGNLTKRMGNYTIVNDTIFLNELLDVTIDNSPKPYNGSAKLQITEERVLTDVNSLVKVDNSSFDATKVELTKESIQDETAFVAETPTLNKILANSIH